MTVLLVPAMMMFCSSICSGSLLYELDSRARWSVIACARAKTSGRERASSIAEINRWCGWLGCGVCP